MFPLKVPNLSQNDPKWKHTPLGSNPETIGQVGCVITSVAAILQYKGVDTDPQRLNAEVNRVGGYVSGNLFVWDALRRIYPNTIQDVIVVRSYYDFVVKGFLRHDIPVIIQASAQPIGGRGYHFFVSLGGQIIMDPWDGTNKPFDTYNADQFRVYTFK